MSEWRELTLGQVCQLKRGYDLPSASRQPGDVPIVSSSGVTGFHSEAKVRGPGVVTGRYGTLGEVFFIENDFWPLNTALYVRDFKGNSPRFVAALLESLELGRNDGAAAVPGVNRNQLHTLPVLCPDDETQKAIASVLQAIDDLIENNKRRIELLEQIAQAIYREWFVRTRYPGYENATFVDSSLGPIPEGWDVCSVSELLEVNPRLKFDKATERPFITMGDLSERSMICFPSEKKPGNAGSKFQNRDTLFARITPSLENGKTGYVQCLAPEEIGRGSTEFIVLRGRLVGPAFTYFLARRDDFRAHAIGSMSGASGRQRVRNACFDTFMVTAPPPALAKRFEQTVERKHSGPA